MERCSIDCAYSVNYVSDVGESDKLGATKRYNSYSDKGTIESLGGFDHLEVGMEVFQEGKDGKMEHVGKVVMYNFENELELAVFQSSSEALTPDKWNAKYYNDEGPNITSLEPLYGTTNWTHYARTNSLQEELDAR